MKPQITITIDGTQGAGKSTLAEYLAAHLREGPGLNVTLNDGGKCPNSDNVFLPEYFDADITINVEQK